MTQVQYFGYIIDECGVHVDPTKIQVIQFWLGSTTLTELYSFLGLSNFYCKFVVGFSHITFPLSQLIKGGEKENFIWSKYQQKAIAEMKHHLCTAPVLTLPYLQQPFEIETNASNYVIVLVLIQQGNPVAYHNQEILDTVQNYPTYEKYMYSIMKEFQQWNH